MLFPSSAPKYEAKVWSNMSVWNTDILKWDYTKSQPRRQKFEIRRRGKAQAASELLSCQEMDNVAQEH
jgi:hypothetical protein